MGKVSGWTIASCVVSIGAAAFGFAKSVHDSKLADQRQSDKIAEAIQNYMDSHALESGSDA